MRWINSYGNFRCGRFFNIARSAALGACFIGWFCLSFAQKRSGLRNSLVAHSDQFVRVVTERLLTYSLGRGVEYQDMPTLRAIVREAAPSKYKFSTLVMAIVKSAPFQSNIKLETSVPQQRASR